MLFSLFHRITERDACVRTPFFTLFNVLLRSFPLSTGSQKETLVCARLSLRFLTSFYALFPFSTGSQRETLVCARLSLRFSTCFYALFPFPQDHRRDACVCALFFTLFNIFLHSFPFSTGSQKETLVGARHVFAGPAGDGKKQKTYEAFEARLSKQKSLFTP